VKITRVRAYPLMSAIEGLSEAPVSVPRASNTAGLIFAGYRSLLVRIDTDEGFTGVGEGLVRLAPHATAAIVTELEGLLIGRDPIDVDVIWEDLYATMANRGHTRGFMIEAIAGIDIALWDLIGQARGEPLHRLLGGAHRRSSPCYASSLRIKPAEQVAADARALVADGFTAVKLKIGRPNRRLDDDLAAIHAVRNAIGPNVELMVDANGAYGVADALYVARGMAGANVRWFEEPIAADDLPGYRRLRSRSDVPIAAGETWFTRFDFRDAFLHEAIDIAQPDVSRCGGVSEARKIATLAHAFHVDFAPHTGQSSAVCLATSMHLAVAAPNAITYEFIAADWSATQANPLRTSISDFDFEATRSGGSVTPPTRPGIGMTIDWEAVERYVVP
jgi:D-galactarolactone cycloisomerase